jgi:BirA family biotin operon repressor/biotin-[acetyl-CoA-carboxylase] ligase
VTTRFGKPHHHHGVIDSTNLLAKDLAEDGAPSGTVVTASEQTAGRGRGERRWVAPADTALLYSAILRPLDLSHILLPLAAPIAVCEACESLAPVSLKVKWPNDVWQGERKLAGVLIEARPPDWAVIGVGINLSVEPGDFPADLRWPATSLDHGVDTDRMREALNESLSRWAEADPADVRREFERRDALAGRRIAWDGGPGDLGRSGTAEGIDERGNLLVRGDDDELVSLGSGEVSPKLR